MIARARAVLAAAFLVGLVIVATEFPLGQLLHERAALAQAGAQLGQLQAQNRQLGAEVSALRDPSTIARIAHDDYGLVTRGERSIVILPSPGSGGRPSGPLSSTSVPRSDLVPSDAIVSAAGGGSATHQPGFWSRLLQRLEFWHASS